MNKDKVIFIIPGYKHQPKNKAYINIVEILKREGYKPIPVPICWKQTTISQNSEYFLQKYKKINSKKKYILGFSFGAMIALIASTKVRVSGLILCSLSPYFKEDIAKADKSLISSLRSERYQDFTKLHCATLVKKVKAKQILMLYGTKEEKPLIKRVYKTFKQITSKHKHLIPIEETDHDIGNRRYLHKIHEIAKGLN